MFNSWALFLISVSFSSGSFFVKTMRFNVGTCLAIFNRARIFSGLSTKTVLNEAEKKIAVEESLAARFKAYFD